VLPLIAATEELHETVGRLGAELSTAYDDDVIVVGVLNGSVVFMADLIRSMTVTPVVDFLAVSAYAPDSGRVRMLKDLDVDIAGRHVVLVEDIVDTGLTLAYLTRELRLRGPASLEVCALVDRPARRILPAEVAFVGFEVPDVFVLGYGLDFAGRYRNLDLLAAADLATLVDDADAYLAELYPA
jgi:hypoxanthine phosphoribosyltransferase